MTDDVAGTLLWERAETEKGSTQLGRFEALLGARGFGPFDTYASLHDFTLKEPGAFWDAMWDFASVIGEKGSGPSFVPGESFAEARFFPEARLNFAENLLRAPTDDIAIIAQNEAGVTIERTRAEMHVNVARLQELLRSDGVGVGDRVAAWLPNCIESYEVMLAVTGLGAIFTSASPDFGVDGVVDRFGQVEPKVLVAAAGYDYGGHHFDCLERLAEIRPQLPSVRRVYVVRADTSPADLGAIDDASLLDEALAGVGPGVFTPHFEQLPFDHPVYVLYSSGTTGKPKSIVHRAGGVLITHLKEQQLHGDVRPGDRVFYFTTTGWMMWNWLASVLASHAAIVVYDGNPAYPSITRIFDMADELGITLLGTSAKFLESAKKAGISPRATHGLDTVRHIVSTGSPLSPEGFAWVYDEISPTAHLASMSGGTDLCGCLVGGNPNGPVYAGEIQGPNLAMAIDVVDVDGESLAPGRQGELVCRQPFPSMPLTFWGDDGDARYRAAYYERFAGMWHQGDFAEWTKHGGMIIHGRSDATLNPGGVRIGTAEIYRLVEDFDDVLECLVIGQQWDNDTRLVLFVKMRDGHPLTDTFADQIRTAIRAGATPRHVPAKVIAVDDIPRTRSGKLVEIAVRDIVHGRTIANIEALANPEALALFKDLPELAT